MMNTHSLDDKRRSCGFADERGTLGCKVNALQVQEGGASTHRILPEGKEEDGEERNFASETELVAILTRSDWRRCIETDKNDSFCVPFSIQMLKVCQPRT